MYARSTQEWWLWAIRGVVAIFFGVVALVFPASSLGLALLLLGAYLQLDGLAITIAVCWGWRAPTALPLAITGLFGFMAGMTALIWPGFGSSFLVPMVGIYCFLRGGLELIHALRIRARTRRAWNLVAASFLALGFGSLLLSQPELQPSTLAWSFAGFVTLTGACLIATALGNQPAVDTVLSADQSPTAGKG